MKFLQSLFILSLFLAVAIRILLSFLYTPRLKNGQYVHFETTLLTEPTSHGSFDTMTVQYTNGFSSIPLSLALPAGSGLHYGQSVAISGKIKVKALKNNQPITTISSAHIKINSDQQNRVFAISAFIRQKIQALYEKIFSQNQAALLLGIVLGIKVNFPKDFLKALQGTGVVHVIAAEGLNVIIVSQFLLGIFGSLLKRQWAIVCALSGLVFYCVLCGLQPSIVRSTIMMVFALFAQLLGRQYSSLYGLMLAACGMLLYNPSWLSDVGFQLSFAATCGIMLIKPLLPEWGMLSEDINTTVAAQVATLPIMLGSFGSYGLVSIIANACILWTIPPLMILGGVGGFIGIALEPIGKFIIFLCLPFLFFFEKVISFFASYPWQITATNMSISITIGYYLLLTSLVMLLRKIKKIKRNVQA